jgi:hypothetical protein
MQCVERLEHVIGLRPEGRQKLMDDGVLAHPAGTVARGEFVRQSSGAWNLIVRQADPRCIVVAIGAQAI